MRKPGRKTTPKITPRASSARSRPGAPAAAPVPVVALEMENGLVLEPLTPAFLVRTLEDLRVPTIAIPAEVLTVDGRLISGRIFVPAAAHLHGGAMRAEEWMNEAGRVLPLPARRGQRARPPEP